MISMFCLVFSSPGKLTPLRSHIRMVRTPDVPRSRVVSDQLQGNSGRQLGATKTPVTMTPTTNKSKMSNLIVDGVTGHAGQRLEFVLL